MPKYTPFLPAEQSPHDGYLRGKFREWHRDHFERRCRISVTISQAQKIVDQICEEEELPHCNVISLREVKGLKEGEDELSGLFFIDDQGNYCIALGATRTPTYVLLHELAHLAEAWFEADAVTRRQKRMKDKGVSHHSRWYQIYLKELVEFYPWALGIEDES